MYTTAPMGMMQAVAPPATNVPAYLPQAAPATARITQMAVFGAQSPSAPAPEQKSFAPQIAARTAAQIQAANPQMATTPESYLLADETVQDPPVWQPSAAPLPSRDVAKQLIGSHDSANAAQLLAQQDMSDIVLPERLDIADMMQRVADKRGDQQVAETRMALVNTNQIRNTGSTRNIQMTSFASMLSPSVMAMAKSQSQHVYAPLKRDMSPTLASTRGAQAYRVAAERLGHYSTKAVEAIGEEHAS